MKYYRVSSIFLNLTPVLPYVALMPYKSSLQNGQYFLIRLRTHLPQIAQIMAPKIEKMAIIQKWLNLQHKVTLMTHPISDFKGCHGIKVGSKVKHFCIIAIFGLLFEPFVASKFSS